MSLQAAAGRFLPYIIKGYYRRTVPCRRRAFLVPNIPSVPVKPVLRTERYPNMRTYPFSSYKFLAHDIKADIDIRHTSYPTDAKFLEHVAHCLHTRQQKRSLRTFKLMYNSWLKKQPAE